jgi:hypothetical protein
MHTTVPLLEKVHSTQRRTQGTLINTLVHYTPRGQTKCNTPEQNTEKKSIEHERTLRIGAAHITAAHGAHHRPCCAVSP